MSKLKDPRIIKRTLLETLVAGTKSVLLLGPRQVGKSTLISNLNPDISINLNNESSFLKFRSNPKELEEMIEASRPKTVFIDEIQRHPDLLNTIQVLIDNAKLVKGSKNIRFFLTGSSARKLKRGQANLLPGRVFSYRLGPLCAAELGYALDVGRALKIGCLPEPYCGASLGEAMKLLSSYSGIYLKEEIQSEAITRSLDGFSRFLMSAAANSGQALDYSKLAKQAKIERKMCTRFYEILEDTLIAYRLDVFDDTTADIVRRPKYFFFDVGVLNGLLENFTSSEDRKGILFEHLVVNQLVNTSQAFDVPIKLHYFRTRAGYEVDLIIQLNGKYYAIEIKSGHCDVSDAKKMKQIDGMLNIKLADHYLVVPEGPSRNIEGVKLRSLNNFLQEVF